MSNWHFRSIVVLLLATVLPLWLGALASHAGENAVNAFDLGWSLGLASYQASVKQTGPARSAIHNAQSAATRLANSGVMGKTDIMTRAQAYADMHAGLVQLRTEYESELRQRSNSNANAYRLGLLIGLAEAQCSSGNFTGVDGSWKYAHDALQQTQTLVATSSLSKLKFNQQLLNDALHFTDNFQRHRDDAYPRAVELRKAYREVVRVSDY